VTWRLLSSPPLGEAPPACTRLVVRWLLDFAAALLAAVSVKCQRLELVCVGVITAVNDGSGEAVLQAGMAELVHRPHGTQDVPLTGVIEERHEAQWSMPSPGELSRGECCRPGM
jgi:hypothetical protein